MLRIAFFAHVRNVIRYLAPTIRCHLMLLTTFQATFQRVQSQPGFSFSRTTKQSFQRSEKSQSQFETRVMNSPCWSELATWTNQSEMIVGTLSSCKKRYSYWPHSYHTRSKDAQKTVFFWGDAFFHSRSQEGSSHTVQWNSSKHIRTFDGRMTRISPSFTNQRDSRQSCSTTTRRNRNSDGSMWLTRSMERPCEGMLLLLAQRVQQDGR